MMANLQHSKEYSVFLSQYSNLCDTMVDIDNLLPYFIPDKTIKVGDLEEIKAKDRTKERNNGTASTAELARTMRSRIDTAQLSAIDVSMGLCLQQYKEYLISCYQNREMEPTRWSKFGGPSLFLDIAIMKSSRLKDKFCEEHAMDLLENNIKYITISNILTDGYQKISLVEGDPGTGKTTLTFKICKQWANNKIQLLGKDLLFLLALRDSHYHRINNLNDLFDKLNCPKLLEYAQQHNGKGLVFILDGWDELPNHLQSQSFFHDIIFKKSVLTCSTIIVTSRPSCSDCIAMAVDDRYYQILGFTPNTVESYIRECFKSNPPSAQSLLDILRSHVHLCQHFYIPITVVIMCFVYRNSGPQLPASLSKLYERFVLLCIRSNICEAQKKQFKSLHNIPNELKATFRKLCDLALKALLDKKLVFDEEELKDLPFATTEQFDGFGLLHVDHITDEFGEKVKCYSFIHRAVQELMAALSALQCNSVEDIVNKHFHVNSYLIDVFPFVIGLIPKEGLKPLVMQLGEVYIRSKASLKLLNIILHCLFEAHDDAICNEFVQAFTGQELHLIPRTLLEYHYVSYFLFNCNFTNFTQLKVTLSSLREMHLEIIDKYYTKSLTEITSFCCINFLSLKDAATLFKILLHQCNLLSLALPSRSCEIPGCIKILCDSICKHHLHLTNLLLPSAKLSNQDLDSLGSVIATLGSLESLNLQGLSFNHGTGLKSSNTFCNALRNTKCLKKVTFGSFQFSEDDLDLFSNIVSENKSFKKLTACDIVDVKAIISILKGLSSNQSLTCFKTWPGPFCTSHRLGQHLGKCLSSNRTLTFIDFTNSGHSQPIEGVQWSPEHVCCIFTGLQSNNTLETLDISGCYVDKTAGDAVCAMLSQNTSLKHLFLNPVHLEKLEAFSIFQTCINNSTLELLTLSWLPGKRSPLAPWSFVHQPNIQSGCIPLWSPQKEFSFAKDEEIIIILDQVQNCRQEKNQPSLIVLWKYNEMKWRKHELLNQNVTSI